MPLAPHLRPTTKIADRAPQILKALLEYLDSPKTAPDNTQKVLFEFAENAITILWCLS